MHPSPEVEGVVSRYLRALASTDAETLSHLYSKHEAALVIGTDPTEWWAGFEEFMSVISAQLAEAHERGGLQIEVTYVRGYEDGNVGWAAVRGVFEFAGRPELPFRLTAVLRVEQGHWRLMQTHTSVGLRNEDVLDLTFTTGLDQVTESLRIEQPSLGGVAAPDGTVSILFTDVQDSTVLAERLGDHEWVDVLHWHHRVVVESASSNRGFVVKSMGDGYMLAFASASDAIVCADRVVAESAAGGESIPLAVRAGIHTGDAVRDLNDFYGHTVTVASRVASLAVGGEVLVTRVVRDLTRGRNFDFGPPRTVELKGVADPYEVMPVMAPA